MGWLKQMVGLERDGVQTKAIIGSGELGAWASGGASRQDGDNFRTNMVTLAAWQDRLAATNPLGLSATWACVNLIAGTIGALPLMVYRTAANGARTVARDHPLYYVLHDSPNFDQTRMDFWEFMSASIELQGNGYASIERRADGSVYSLTPIAPHTVTTERGPNGLVYKWRVGDRVFQRPVTEVLHIRGPLGDSASGLSTLAACAGVFAGAISAEGASANVFSNGLRPSGVLSTDPTVKLNKEQREEFNGYLQANFQGSMNMGRPMLLDGGMKWQQLNITPEDAQMLESRKFGGEEICRIFGVPPVMIGYGDQASNWGTGVEQQMLIFKQMTLSRRLSRIEQALTKQLLLPADRVAGITIEFNLEGLLRGDSKGRAEVNDIRLKNKSLTINEVRAQDNQPPVAWGDLPWAQMQDVQLGADGTVPGDQA